MSKRNIILGVSIIVILPLFFLVFNSINPKKEVNIPVVETISNDLDDHRAINIAFTTDKKYKEYLKVALNSAIVNKKTDNYYNVYILCVDLSEKDMSEFKKFENNNVNIITIPLSVDMFRNAFKNKINLFYISEADLFKFFIPDLFKNLDKILYLDSDILVLDDLEQLYNTDIKDKYIAAVKRYNFIGNRKKDDYNCGVILFNLKKLREDDIVGKLIEAKNKDEDGRSTQHSFNSIITLKDVRLLSPIYNNNASTSNKNDFEKYNFKKNYAPFCNNMNNMDDLDKQTVIVHFIGYQKPWHQSEDMRFREFWWEYARMVNPNLKIEKRTFFERIKIAYIMTIRSSTKKTFFEYVRKFYKVFKNS